jgi:hypothetical protein
MYIHVCFCTVPARNVAVLVSMIYEGVIMLKWWEKTVEYYFVRKFVDESMLVAPLDGAEETEGGDALLSNGLKWILIEFKKDINTIKSEYEKFSNYEAAKSALFVEDGHHFLVFGLLAEKGNFGLGARTYFSNSSPSNINDLLSAGVDLERFQLYLNKFAAFKKNSTGSSGGFSLNSSMVAGVVETEGKSTIVTCMSLMEYVLTMQKNLVHSKNLIKSKEIEKGRSSSMER